MINYIWLSNAFAVFLKENKVDDTIAKCFFLKFYDNTVSVIDNALSWNSTAPSYYFWYFLQLKWILFLLKNRKEHNIDFSTLLSEFEIIFSFSTHYDEGKDDDKTMYKNGLYKITKMKYKIQYEKYKKYEEILKIINE